MSNKLTKAQYENLLYLNNKHHIEVCTSMGRAFGQILFADGEDAKRVLASINTFFCWGYFEHEERNYHGMRYSRLTINHRGKQALVESQPEVTSV
tara:strand:+ start:589 stop:873 length:285 start_codon:yes stop_codon:yes gene_type:complete